VRAALAAALAAVLLAGCSSGGRQGAVQPTVAGCRAALDRLGDRLIADPKAFHGQPVQSPAACRGLPAPVVERLGRQEIARVLRAVLGHP